MPIAVALIAGSLAGVNPCGFPLLPAFLLLCRGRREPPSEGGFPRGAGAACWGPRHTGFLGVFAVIGIPISYGATEITRAVPWADLWRRTIRRGLWAAIAAALLIPSSTAAQVPGDPQRGREVFEQNCAMCHGSDASGMMGMHPSLRGATERLSREGVEVTIRNGRDVQPPMPAFEGRLSDGEISDVIAYLDSLPVGLRNFGPGDGMMDGMGDMMGRSGMGSNRVPWLLVGLLTIALIGTAIALAMRSGVGRGGRRSQALHILEERYARGDIDHDEFEERRRTLSR